MVSEQPNANRISINSAEQDDHIESVTVFQADRAEIKRRINLDLKAGQNHVDIERLPTCVNEDSIRVDGTGNAVIFDVVYHKPYQSPGQSSSDEPHQQAVAEALRALESLQKEREVAEEQSNFLNSYGKTLDSKSINIDDVQKFLDMFAPRQIAVAKRIQELDMQIGDAQKAYNEAQEKVYADARGAKRGTKITVTVLAETDGPAELVLTYVVSNASWTPLYDVRATIAKSPDAPSKVALHYRASITQTTGENWPDVALTLSTASPQLGSEVPILSAWRIGFPAPPPPPPMVMRSARPRAAFGKRASRAEPSADMLEMDESMPMMMTLAGSAAPPMAMRQAQVVSAGVLSASFGISGRSDIPSDEGSHKVVIAVLDLQTELEWVCVPREKESVFLICKVVNSSEFTLLPGEASVFMDDNFVSKSRIEHVAPNDSFKTSLGTDSALRVTYPSARTLKRTVNQSNFAFLNKDNKQSVEGHSQRITIRNSRPTAVSALRAIDHLPVSTDARIKVNVISPSSIGPIDEDNSHGHESSEETKNKVRPWANVQKGVKARWAKLDVAGEGTVEWECEVQPNEEVELELAWEVYAPVGERWESL